MNCSFYVYGSFLDGFSLYPENSKELLFKEIERLAIHKTQIVTHREGNLMYYNYIRNLYGNKPNHARYLGLCILLNGVMLDDFQMLFSIFETTFEKVAYDNEIIGIDDTGKIVPMCLSLDTHTIGIRKICDILRVHMEAMEIHCIELPPVAFEISNTTVQSCSFSFPNSRILNHSVRYPYVVIEKNQSYDSPGLAHYLQRLQDLYGAVNKKSHSNNRLFLWVIIALIFFIIIFFALLKRTAIH